MSRRSTRRLSGGSWRWPTRRRSSSSAVARGDHRPDSDIDILVIAESSEPRYRRSGPLYGALASLPCEVDISVYTPSEVAAWRDVRQAFVTTAIREGIVLYERAA